MPVPSCVAMSNLTLPAGAGSERLTVKVNVVLPEFPSFAVTSVTLKAGPTTVNVAGLLFAVVVPSVAEAVMCATPGLCVPTFAITAPVVSFVEVESLVATVVLSEVKVIGKPFIARPN